MAGLVAVVIAGVAGAALGLVAGYNRGWLDSVTMRALDTLLAFPAIFLAIGIVAVIGPGYVNATLAVAIIYTPQIARLVRATTLAETAKEYVEAARCLGASDAHHAQAILPNCAAALWSDGDCSARRVIIEASRPVGPPSLQTSWGAMLKPPRIPEQVLDLRHFPGWPSRSWRWAELLER
jgi:dipeptide transport system permease protein